MIKTEENMEGIVEEVNIDETPNEISNEMEGIVEDNVDEIPNKMDQIPIKMNSMPNLTTDNGSSKKSKIGICLLIIAVLAIIGTIIYVLHNRNNSQTLRPTYAPRYEPTYQPTHSPNYKTTSTHILCYPNSNEDCNVFISGDCSYSSCDIDTKKVANDLISHFDTIIPGFMNSPLYNHEKPKYFWHGTGHYTTKITNPTQFTFNSKAPALYTMVVGNYSKRLTFSAERALGSGNSVSKSKKLIGYFAVFEVNETECYESSIDRLMLGISSLYDNKIHIRTGNDYEIKQDGIKNGFPGYKNLTNELADVYVFPYKASMECQLKIVKSYALINDPKFQYHSTANSLHKQGRSYDIFYNNPTTSPTYRPIYRRSYMTMYSPTPSPTYRQTYRQNSNYQSTSTSTSTKVLCDPNSNKNCSIFIFGDCKGSSCDIDTTQVANDLTSHFNTIIPGYMDSPSYNHEKPKYFWHGTGYHANPTNPTQFTFNSKSPDLWTMVVGKYSKRLTFSMGRAFCSNIVRQSKALIGYIAIFEVDETQCYHTSIDRLEIGSTVTSSNTNKIHARTGSDYQITRDGIINGYPGYKSLSNTLPDVYVFPYQASIDCKLKIVKSYALINDPNFNQYSMANSLNKQGKSYKISHNNPTPSPTNTPAYTQSYRQSSSSKTTSIPNKVSSTKVSITCGASNPKDCQVNIKGVCNSLSCNIDTIYVMNQLIKDFNTYKPGFMDSPLYNHEEPKYFWHGTDSSNPLNFQFSLLYPNQFWTTVVGKYAKNLFWAWAYSFNWKSSVDETTDIIGYIAVFEVDNYSCYKKNPDRIHIGYYSARVSDYLLQTDNIYGRNGYSPGAQIAQEAQKNGYPGHKGRSNEYPDAYIFTAKAAVECKLKVTRSYTLKNNPY